MCSSDLKERQRMKKIMRKKDRPWERRREGERERDSELEVEHMDKGGSF